MNPLREALYDRLTGDATLTGLLATPTSIYHRVAPREAVEPLIVFDKQAGSDVPAFGGKAFETQLWLVKATDRSLSAAVAEEIADRIETVLTSSPLSLSSGTVLYCRRETAVDFGEQDGADMFQHVGGVYRITTAP